MSKGSAYKHRITVACRALQRRSAGPSSSVLLIWRWPRKQQLPHLRDVGFLNPSLAFVIRFCYSSNGLYEGISHNSSGGVVNYISVANVGTSIPCDSSRPGFKGT